MVKAKPKAPSYDDLESQAFSDLLAAIQSGDEEAGRAALSDFVKACIERSDTGSDEA